MPFLRSLTLAAAALALAACQTTSFRSAWYDTSYNGGVLKRIVVIASDGTTSDSRVFEDIFVQKLNAAGVQGVPGYTTIPPGARGSEGPFAAAVAATGADGVLMIRLLRVDTKTQVSTVMMPGPMWGPWGGLLRRAGLVPDHRRHAVRHRDGRVEPLPRQTKRLIWAATTETMNPTSVAKEAPVFADLLIAQFRARGLMPPRPSRGDGGAEATAGRLGRAQAHRAAVPKGQREFVAGDVVARHLRRVGAGTRCPANPAGSLSWSSQRVPSSSRCRSLRRSRLPRLQSARNSTRPPGWNASV